MDILDICLPTYLHADFSIKAMNKGIHVLCKKPISLNAEDVERIYDTAKRNKVCFMTAQVVRFWPEYIMLKELYETQKYGRLLSGYMSRLGNTPPWSWDGWMTDETRSGLVPFDLHIHDLDYMVYVFGRPQKVTCHRRKRPQQDCINAVYQFDGFYVGAEAAWYAGAYPFQAGYRFQFEHAVVSFEGGKCIIYEDDGTVTNLTNQADGDTGSINLPKSNAYAEEIRYFADCVKKGEFPDKVKPEELRAVIELLKELQA